MSFITKMIIKITDNDKIKTLNLPLLIKQSNGAGDGVQSNKCHNIIKEFDNSNEILIQTHRIPPELRS